MSTYPVKTLLDLWKQSKLTVEQAVGYLIQNLSALVQQIKELEQRSQQLEQKSSSE